ncbi:hypothetical protein M422DRAFT_22792 [Sphaerobolus stellatus SS14]|nr:hypothetical protein M422DRAFT_22792 [Sphaerobolus stellatus SS14]
MRTRHTSHPLAAFPVYTSTFLSDDLLVLGGGGGFGKSGVKNRIRVYKVQSDEKIDLVDELELGADDAPMSIASYPENEEFVCGINSASTEMKKGNNENCRAFSFKGEKIKPLRQRGTFQAEDGEDYQNVTAFNPAHDVLAVGSSKNDVHFLTYKSFDPAYSPVQVEPVHAEKKPGQLYDVTISSENVVVASTTHLQVYSFPPKKGKGKQALILVKILEPPTSPVPELTFRAARYHPTDPNVLYTVLNTSPRRVRGKATPSRQAYVCSWDVKTWSVLNIRKVSEKAATCFDISRDGKLLALGSSDYAIQLLDASTLAPLLTILKAHELPPTTLAFNPSASLLVSGSADNSIRVITVPTNFGSSSPKIITILLALLFLLLAIAFQRGSIRL